MFWTIQALSTDPGLKVALLRARFSPFKKKKKKTRAGNEWSNILPKFSHARKKPPPPLSGCCCCRCCCCCCCCCYCLFGGKSSLCLLCVFIFFQRVGSHLSFRGVLSIKIKKNGFTGTTVPKTKTIRTAEMAKFW